MRRQRKKKECLLVCWVWDWVRSESKCGPTSDSMDMSLSESITANDATVTRHGGKQSINFFSPIYMFLLCLVSVATASSVYLRISGRSSVVYGFKVTFD